MLKRAVKRMMREWGYEIVPVATPPSLRESEPDVTEEEWRVIDTVKPYTMLSLERLLANIRSISYLCRNRIAGDIVECGVWRGGSSMAMALSLMAHNERSRTIWLYDTFEGMTEPTEADRIHSGASASALLQAAREYERKESSRVIAYASLEDVKANLARTGYPLQRHIKGPVETTIPLTVPERVALLRLDTDWYESTRHELEHLYPRLVPGGILIIDDYGWWQGARKAVDEYFAGQAVYLHRIDTTGRLLVKPCC